MTVTVWGPLADELGHTWWTEALPLASVAGRLIAEERHTFAARPMTEFRTRQPARIPLDLDHRTACGEVVYLERDDRHLVAVAVADLEPSDLDAFGPVSYSAQVARDRDSGETELRSVAIVPSTQAATVGLAPLRWIDGDLRRGALRLVGLGQTPPVLRRADEWCRHRRAGDPLTVVERRALAVEHAPSEHGWQRATFIDDEPVSTRRYSPARSDSSGRPATPVEFSGHRGRVIDVR